MLKPRKWIRKPIVVDEVVVTETNLEEVAKWANGEVKSDENGPYVKVRVHHPRTEKQTKAYVGDHVLYAGTGYKVYTDKAFQNSFERFTESEIVGVVEGDVVVPKRVAKKVKADA